MTGATRTGAPQSVAIPPLSLEEEDQVLLSRITNDERQLKRLVKKFHSLTTLSQQPTQSNEHSKLIQESRESFLVELASFQLNLQKSTMICDAETRQAEEYRRDRQNIIEEHGVLRDQIEQLKTALEHAQIARRRKMEYDLVAEKVNTLPSREELETTIQGLENDMMAIRSDHEDQSKLIQNQKTSLDSVIAELGSLRFIGKDKDATSSADSPRDTPGPQDEEGEGGMSIKEESADETPHGPSALDIEDIEMGEVEEDVRKSRKKSREEMEEGEATDASSELSEIPEDV